MEQTHKKFMIKSNISLSRKSLNYQEDIKRRLLKSKIDHYIWKTITVQHGKSFHQQYFKQVKIKVSNVHEKVNGGEKTYIMY